MHKLTVVRGVTGYSLSLYFWERGTYYNNSFFFNSLYECELSEGRCVDMLIFCKRINNQAGS